MISAERMTGVNTGGPRKIVVGGAQLLHPMLHHQGGEGGVVCHVAGGVTREHRVL
ncbi:MAG: hypothetical protein GW870_07905 [Deltaproteobacteria bacterium]|nr:hypothetical protein [Deltaproteobacteria bacterium]NCP97143.1 hypothetical protein [Deltaproteobacteria bacterium]